MIDSATIKKISEAVYIRPQTMQDIAHLINKNWRTADRYVDRISREQGTIEAITFRKGTQGALKIVFWRNIERIHSTSFQEGLLEKIKSGRTKKDFSPFDIFQYVDEKKRDAVAYKRYSGFGNHKMVDVLRNCRRQLLSFSGNLSWLNIPHVLDAIEELIRSNVDLKILTRVDIASVSNINRLLEIENKVGKNRVEIRHCEQPLRGLVIDNGQARFMEQKNPRTYKEGELKETVTFFYDINDEEWVAWLQKVFFSLFRNSIDYRKRLNDLKAIRNLEV